MLICDNSPVIFRVIGYGDKTHGVIGRIGMSGYCGLCAEAVTTSAGTAPTGKEQMVIVLATERVAGLEHLLQMFYRAKVLTLLVATEDLNIPVDFFDSCAIAPVDCFYDIVKTLLDVVFKPGYNTCDFNDLALTLRDTGLFSVITSHGQDKNSCLSGAIDSISEKIGPENGIENMIIVLSVNNAGSCMTLKEIRPFVKYIDSMSENIHVVWQMREDESLDNRTIMLSVIAAGRELAVATHF